MTSGVGCDPRGGADRVVGAASPRGRGLCGTRRASVPRVGALWLHGTDQHWQLADNIARDMSERSRRERVREAHLSAHCGTGLVSKRGRHL